MHQPTPHSDVNAVIERLFTGVQGVLGQHCIGMYLYGSLASGHFDQDSDIDVLVVTDEDIPDGVLAALQAMHASVAAVDSPWATQLEVSYIPLKALRYYDPKLALHPHLDRGSGESLRMMQHDSDWVVQRHVLRERGILLCGPSPHTLIDPVTPDDLRASMLEVAKGWLTPMLRDPGPLQKRGYQAYMVLTLCRILYTLHHGTVAPKPVAARWAIETLGKQWAPLIEGALVGRLDSQSEARREDVIGTKELILYTIEHCQQPETSVSIE